MRCVINKCNRNTCTMVMQHVWDLYLGCDLHILQIRRFYQGVTSVWCNYQSCGATCIRAILPKTILAIQFWGCDLYSGATYTPWYVVVALAT